MTEKVVFLAFRTDKADTDTRELLACATCRNKSWTVVYESGSQYPRLACTACGTNGGSFGWIGETP